MKSTIALAAALLAASAAVAAPETCSKPGTTAANVAVTKRLYQAMNTRSGQILDGVLAVGWRDIPMPPGQGPGLAGMKASIKLFGSVFKDFTVTNDEFIATGNQVVVRSTNRGTHVGTFAGIAPTGKSFAMTSIDIHTLCDGKIIETRHVEDWLGTLVQIGFLPLK